MRLRQAPINPEYSSCRTAWIDAWQHDWLDLSAFSGQTVTLQFGFQTQAAGQQIALDKVSVGDSAVGVYPVYLPLIKRNS